MSDHVDIGLTWRSSERLGEPEAEACLALTDKAADVDGVTPLSDAVRLRVEQHGSGGRHVVGVIDGEAVAYGFVLAEADAEAEAEAEASAEFLVAPQHRRRGIGGRLLDELSAGLEGKSRLSMWAHGNLPGATALARSRAMTTGRSLHRMTRSLDDDPGEPTWADGITVRTFVVGHDEDAWLRVNARAFADLPDQGRWTIKDLREREAARWFDPRGFFLAEKEGELVGFHWTKVHVARGTVPAIGEVHVIGVDPDAQGLGLGKSLLTKGLRHLHDQGLAEVMLYVDGDNPNAIALYERSGFTTRDIDVQWLMATGQPGLNQ